MSRSKRVTIFVLTFILILLASTAWAEGGVRPPADAAVTSNGELLSRAKTCDVLPLQLDGPLAVSDENGTVYGCISMLYQTWFEVTDEALWQQVGLERVQGVVSFSELTAMGKQLEIYNQSAKEPVMLFSLLPQRFPNAFAPLPSVQEDWDAMAAVTGTECENALLTERVLTIDALDDGCYIGGIEIDGEIYPLSEPEARCLSVDAGNEGAGDLQRRIVQFAQQVSPVQTGVLPTDMTYDALRADWVYDSAVPSEENFELWKRML
ncbi:MAG: hypothetical protein ACI3W5_12000 [Faecousia sp.]